MSVEYIYMCVCRLSDVCLVLQPTLHFFESGKKAAEIVGADVGRLKDTMEELYG